MVPSTKAKTTLSALLLIVLVLAAFALSVRGAFLWDDDAHVSANPVIIGPLGLREVWTTAAANYFPLVLTNFWLQHAWWGLNPAGYHIVTMLFHAASAVLLWRVLLQLGVRGAWVAAAVWAVHPVQVESVAWICELKNTQSAFFFLGAILCYGRWLPRPGQTAAKANAAYGLAFACALAAILSKPSTVMLPVVLLLCAWWRERSVRLRTLVSTVPFFLISGVASLWTVWEQKFHSGAIGQEWNHSLAERVAIACRVQWFYLGKLVWPDLSFIYARWLPGDPWYWIFAAATVVVIGLVIIGWRTQPSRMRVVTFAGAYFVVMLFPVLGLFDVYFFRYSYVGDHFQYLASIAPIAAGVGVAATLLESSGAIVIAVATLAALGGSTIARCRVFLDNETLWQDTLAANPSATLAITQLGAIESLRGNRDRAVAYFNRALTLDDGDFYAHNGLGCEFMAAGDLPRAIAELRRAVELDPTNADGHNNLGRALQNAGQLAEAKRHYEEALRLRPGNANAETNLGTLLSDMGDSSAAIPHFEAALKQKPGSAGFHHNLANALRGQNRFSEAVKEYETAIQLGDLPESHDDLGVTFEAMGRKADAMAHYEQALRLKPDFAAARQHLAALHVADGLAAAGAGNMDAALAALGRAIAVDPQFGPAHFNRGVALAQLGRWPEARDEFSATTRLQPKSSPAHRYLAIALANLGRHQEALAEADVALQLDANSRENLETREQIKRALNQR